MSKILVTYFSASGVTKQKAIQLGNFLNATLDEIKPVKIYTKDDLDWRNKNSRSTLEMTNEKSRPDFIKSSVNPEYFDIIFIGFPIWWGVEPRIIDSYLEAYNLKDKAIIPFATSGGSPIGYCIKHLRKVHANLNIKEGLLFNFDIDFNEVLTLLK